MFGTFGLGRWWSVKAGFILFLVMRPSLDQHTFRCIIVVDLVLLIGCSVHTLTSAWHELAAALIRSLRGFKNLLITYASSFL